MTSSASDTANPKVTVSQGNSSLASEKRTMAATAAGSGTPRKTGTPVKAKETIGQKPRPVSGTSRPSTKPVAPEPSLKPQSKPASSRPIASRVTATSDVAKKPSSLTTNKVATSANRPSAGPPKPASGSTRPTSGTA